MIDDSDQIRWFLKHVFNKEYQILEARNGQDGINVALKEEPDLILCDVMMPVKDGYETCREIKNDPKMAQTPVVMLTAKVESEDVITGIEAGADDYITKPFDVEILRSKINSLMKKRDDMKRYFSNSSAASHNEENTLSTNPFMDAVVKNIEKHLDDSTFEAKVLADSLNMSLPTLYRKIKQYSDLSILELTRNIRLKKPPNCLPASNTPYRKSPKWWDLTIRLHSVNVLPSNTELHLHNTEFQLKAGHSVFRTISRTIFLSYSCSIIRCKHHKN